MPQIINILGNGRYLPAVGGTDVNGASRVRLTHHASHTDPHEVEIIDKDNNFISLFIMAPAEELIIRKNSTDKLRAIYTGGELVWATPIGYADNSYPEDDIKIINGYQSRVLSPWNNQPVGSDMGNEDDAFDGLTLIRCTNTSSASTMQIRIIDEINGTFPVDLGEEYPRVGNLMINPGSSVCIKKKPRQRILGQGINIQAVPVAY